MQTPTTRQIITVIAAGIGTSLLGWGIIAGWATLNPAPPSSTATDDARVTPSHLPPTPAASTNAGSNTDEPAPQLTTADQTRIVQAATDTIQAFAKPAKPTSQAAWWAAFSEHLTDEAKHDFEGTDPEVVPITRIAGTPTLLDTDGSYRHLVEVPTDAGDFLVEVQVMDEDVHTARLLISAIVFPEETR